MKIIVFGATGRTGRELVRQAATREHSITAFVRDPARLPAGVALRAVEGDLADIDQVAEAIWGNAAVFSALGVNHEGPPLSLAEAAANIVTAMRHHSVSRLIVLGAAGALPGAYKYQSALAAMRYWVAGKTVGRERLRAQAEQERVITSSDTDYTIVRPARLTEGPFTGNYRVLPDSLPSRGLRISRSDVADFMLKQLADPRFHRQQPYLAD